MQPCAPRLCHESREERQGERAVPVGWGALCGAGTLPEMELDSILTLHPSVT